MPGLLVTDPAQRLDLAYLFANSDKRTIQELAETAQNIIPGVSARAAMVHLADLPTLISFLGKQSEVRPEVVIDFPDGAGGEYTKAAQAEMTRFWGASGADVVINLKLAADRSTPFYVHSELAEVKRYLKEVKAICQIPYLWQHDRAAIPWLIDCLTNAKIFCIKDWTTRQNFSTPVDVTLDTRLSYTEYMAEYITTHNLPLLIKIAGGVDATNARSFINAGADLLGISYPKAKSVREALL